MYIYITHCGSLWIKDRNRKRKKKEQPSQIRGLLAYQLNPFLFSVSLTAFLLDFCKIPEQPDQDTWSHVSWVLGTGGRYGCTWGSSQCRDGAPCPGVRTVRGAGKVTHTLLSPTLWQCLLKRLSIFLHAFYLGVTEGLQSDTDTTQPSWAPTIPHLPNQSMAFLLPWEHNQVWRSPHAQFPTPNSPGGAGPGGRPCAMSLSLAHRSLGLSRGLPREGSLWPEALEAMPRASSKSYTRAKLLAEVPHTRDPRSLKLSENI